MTSFLHLFHLEEFNEYLNGIKTNGIYDALLDKWLGSDDSLKNLDEYQLSGKNGTLQVVVLPDNTPFSYYTSDKGLCGLAVEMALEFGDEYGYDIEFEQANVSSSFTGLSSGKYDILAGSLSVTEERKQTINFSDSFYNGGMVLVARSADITKNTSYTQQYITSPQQLNNKEYTVGVVNGTYGMFAVEELLPEAEVLMFSDHVTGYESVRQGQTDGFVYCSNDMPDIGANRMMENADNESILAWLLGAAYPVLIFVLLLPHLLIFLIYVSYRVSCALFRRGATTYEA